MTIGTRPVALGDSEDGEDVQSPARGCERRDPLILENFLVHCLAARPEFVFDGIRDASERNMVDRLSGEYRTE